MTNEEIFFLYFEIGTEELSVVNDKTYTVQSW